MSADYSLFYAVSRLHGQTADYHLHIYLINMRALHLRRSKKLTQGRVIGSSVSSASTIVVVNSHESLMAIDMFDSDLWVDIYCHTINVQLC